MLRKDGTRGGQAMPWPQNNNNNNNNKAQQGNYGYNLISTKKKMKRKEKGNQMFQRDWELEKYRDVGFFVIDYFVVNLYQGWFTKKKKEKSRDESCI